MILTVTLSLLLSAEPSFSLGVLAVSVGVDCTLELGWDDLFSVSVLISVSVSCCVAVAKTKENKNEATTQGSQSTVPPQSHICTEELSHSGSIHPPKPPKLCVRHHYLTVCKISCAQASELVGRGSHSSWYSNSNKRWPLSCSWHTIASSWSRPLLAAFPVPAASSPQQSNDLVPVPGSDAFQPLSVLVQNPEKDGLAFSTPQQQRVKQ